MRNILPFLHLGAITAWADANPLHWAANKIEAWDDNRLQALMPFVRSHYWSTSHSVNVFSVVGTAHPDYIGLTWDEFLRTGKRMSVNQHLLETSPQYYFDTMVKQPTMLYVSLNGKHWCVNGDGNHRTCLARFHFERMNAAGHPSQTMIHGVTVDDYRVDWRLYDVFMKLQALMDTRQSRPGRVEGFRHHTGREDGPAWKIDRFDPKIRYQPQQGEERLLDLAAAHQLLHELTQRRAGLLGWLRR